MRYKEIVWFVVIVLSIRSSASRSANRRPCDIYEDAGTPCVGAFSTTRALFVSYIGPLYDLKRQIDGKTRAIACTEEGGLADSASHEAFCNSTDCTMERIYDQSKYANHLTIAPGGPWYSPFPDHGVNASRAKTSMRGHTVYGAFFEGKMGYRNDNTTGVATGDAPETMYMVVEARHFNNKCTYGRTLCGLSLLRL